MVAEQPLSLAVPFCDGPCSSCFPRLRPFCLLCSCEWCAERLKMLAVSFCLWVMRRTAKKRAATSCLWMIGGRLQDCSIVLFLSDVQNGKKACSYLLFMNDWRAVTMLAVSFCVWVMCRTAKKRAATSCLWLIGGRLKTLAVSFCRRPSSFAFLAIHLQGGQGNADSCALGVWLCTRCVCACVCVRVRVCVCVRVCACVCVCLSCMICPNKGTCLFIEGAAQFFLQGFGRGQKRWICKAALAILWCVCACVCMCVCVCLQAL